MEQNATLAPRVQLTLARLNIEEQRIVQLATQLDRARQELTGNSLALRRTSDELELVEARVEIDLPSLLGAERPGPSPCEIQVDPRGHKT